MNQNIEGFSKLVENIVNKAESILIEYPLCNSCLGRMFAKYGIGLSNYDRGFTLKTLLAIKIHNEYTTNTPRREVHKILAENGGGQIASTYRKIYGEQIEPRKCHICSGKLGETLIEAIAREACSKLREYSASTFLVGIVLDREILERELEIIVKHGSDSTESIKRELKREIGKAIMETCNIQPDFAKPDVVLVISFDREFNYSISVEANPIFLTGKYWKNGRNISHIPWYTRSGGKKYPISIQEFIEYALKDLFEAEEVVIHAAGREDVDARMIGSGRPLIIEVKKPKRRSVPIDQVNSVLLEKYTIAPIRVEVYSESSRREIGLIKETSKQKKKVYRVSIYSSEPVNPSELQALEEFFSNREIKQRTPTRILRRKKDRERRRRVYTVKTYMVSNRVFEALIHCDGGLYVKELVHGDNGRTTPSFSEYLGKKLIPFELDVVYVEDVK